MLYFVNSNLELAFILSKYLFSPDLPLVTTKCTALHTFPPHCTAGLHFTLSTTLHCWTALSTFHHAALLDCTSHFPPHCTAGLHFTLCATLFVGREILGSCKFSASTVLYSLLQLGHFLQTRDRLEYRFVSNYFQLP